MPFKVDVEVQYCSLLLSEVVSIKGAQACWQGGGYIIPHLEAICQVLDRLLNLSETVFFVSIKNC